ncbi:MAG: hypothetical protein DRJ47_06625 [Thermoprotei archaeon]|nr:MAG: hypothetical protein DRJ47_06625 [Thermoprotei archaeon]
MIVDPNDVLSDWLREKKKEHEFRSPDVIYVTELVSCPLKRLYANKYPEIADAELFSSVTLHGTLVHEAVLVLLQEKYSEMGYEVDREVEIEKQVLGYTIRGRIDLLIRDGEEVYVLELKNPKTRGQWPYEHNVDQVRIYMNIVGASRGVLMYVTHDGRATYEVDTSMSDNELECRVIETVSRKIAPRYSWECRYCCYSHLCSKAVLRTS